MVGALWVLTIASLHAQDLESRVTEHKLKNGMTFLFVERHQAPVFSAAVQFRAGGFDEQSGSTGIAHLLEHMAFKGTKVIGTRDYEKERPLLDRMDYLAKLLRDKLIVSGGKETAGIKYLREALVEVQAKHRELVVKDEFSEIYSRNGASGSNAFTSQDRTAYVVSLPSNRLELWALMESQRMASPVLREFYSERDVVMEERRMRYETNPQGKLYETLITSAFTAHPYGLPIIGWSSDIGMALRGRAEEFHRLYYAPNNAVAVLVGDLDIDEAKRLAEKYFGAIRTKPNPPAVVTYEPEQAGERRAQVEWDANPVVYIAYHKPTAPHYDDTVFDVIDSILSSGRTSRLHTSLVKKQRVAVAVGTGAGPGARYPHLFIAYAVPLQPHTAEDVEEAIYREIERLKTEPVSDRELQRVRNQIEASQVRELSSNSGLADQLAWAEIVFGDWREILRNRERIARVTKADIMRVAAKYLTKKNRTVATLVKVQEGTG